MSDRNFNLKKTFSLLLSTFPLLLTTPILITNTPVTAATCNVETSKAADLVSVLNGDLVASNLFVNSPAQPLNVAGVRVVPDDNDGGFTGSFFFQGQQRLADGFSATFDFRLTGGTTEGFAFVIQNDRTSSILGDPGSGLGFRDGFAEYLSVGFDVCSDRPAACFEEKLSVQVLPTNGASTVVNSAVVPSGTDLKNGEVHTATVNYLQDTNIVNVFIDGTKLLEADLSTVVGLAGFEDFAANAALEAAKQRTFVDVLMDSRFGFVGFTASNGDDPLNVDLLTFAMKEIGADSRLSDVFEFDTVIDFGKRIEYRYVLVDSCNIQLSAAAAAAVNVSISSDIIATLTQNADDVEAGDTPIVLTADITQNRDGSFSLFFSLPQLEVSSWDLFVELRGVVAQNMPAENILRTVEPKAGGLNKQTLILLICVIIVLVIATVYMVRRLDQYRQNLKKHKEDIEYGKTKKQIDEIDAKIVYKMNPMMASLDEMKKRLQDNMEILERLRNGQEQAMDSNYTIEQLVKENDELRGEMNKLKMEEQLREAGNVGTTRGDGTKRFGGGMEGHKEFDQERG